MKENMILAHMDCAERYARLSTARRMKVGALVVQGDRVISIGYNGTEPGADNNCEIEPENWDGDIQKLVSKPDVIHAEANALNKLEAEYEAGRLVWTEGFGADLFCNYSCCVSCATKMVQHGIRRFFYRHKYRDLSGLDYLADHGVEVKQIV
jgi:dCMP deaminase